VVVSQHETEKGNQIGERIFFAKNGKNKMVENKLLNNWSQTAEHKKHSDKAAKVSFTTRGDG
jgi:hypothetical protein